MAILRRGFGTYERYVEAQGRKAREERNELLSGFASSVQHFTKIFNEAKTHLRQGEPVLCLGARTGAEAVAARRCGFPGSVGIDLHPVGPHALRGDWHHMPEFVDARFGNVYTNSFDHCLLFEKAMDEVLRVLKPGGVFYLMASDKGTKDDARAQEWVTSQKHNEAMFWHHSDDLREAVLWFVGERGERFKAKTQWRTGQWGHYVFAKVGVAPTEEVS